MYKTIISILLFISALHGDNIKSPAAFLGYGLGEKFTFHHKVVSYFKHVSDASPNVKLISYGKTYEQRPLLVAVISSEENINIIEDILDGEYLKIDSLQNYYGFFDSLFTEYADKRLFNHEGEAEISLF